MSKSIHVLLALMLAFSSSAVLAQQGETKATRESPAAVWKNERNFKQVQKAWELVAEEQYAEAEAEFRELADRISDPYEKSQALFGLAQSLMMLEKYDPALKIYEDIINLDVLPNKPHFDSMFQLANLYYMRERYDDTLRWLDRWKRESGEEKVEEYELRAAVYSAKDQYRNAIQAIDKAIAMSEKPKETWYQLKLGMHYELKEFRESREVLQILVRNWPSKKQYWVQLSSINVTLKNDEDALAILALAHRNGMLDSEQDYKQLFNLYGYLQVPVKAAEVMAEGLDKGIIEPTRKNLEQLGNAWYAARELEKSVVALKKAANKNSEDGKLDMQIAYIYVDQEKWQEAQQSLAAAIRKGGLTETQTGQMHVLLGVSYLNTEQLDKARSELKKAQRFPKSRAAASQWINHIDELKKAA